MKQIFLCLTFWSICLFSVAQDNQEPEEKGFKRENLFLGGNLTVSFSNNVTSLGINPYFGYSIYKWLDAAFSMNVEYVSERDYPFPGDKIRQMLYGPGVFVRIYPIKFLFVQGQYEHNFVTQKYFPGPNSYYIPQKINRDINSLLLGIGYASGREPDENQYYYVSVSIDVLQMPFSPYVDNYNNALPIIKAGFNFRLFAPGRRKRH